jgi:hypothetical protein
MARGKASALIGLRFWDSESGSVMGRGEVFEATPLDFIHQMMELFSIR